jgi:hypothetical protein
MPIWILLNVNFCCNLLCQLYDPMLAISFMRECISEPMNPGPLFIIRNTFLFTLPLFLFLVIINFENTKIFPLLHFTNQNTTTISFTVYHCIAYYFSLHAISDFLAPLHLHIYFQFCILTHTLCLTTTLWGWGHKANLFTLRVVRRGTGRIHLHTVPREFDINPRVTLVEKTTLPCAQHSTTGVST